ncbi:MAG: hypothetical protein IT325_12215, partial [Anaerolineae bacterium]|nr:hypothetical protein [Anaerolineae bacterium]
MMIRFLARFISLLVTLAALAGCTLTQSPATPRAITATPVAQLATATSAPTLPPSPTVAPSDTPAPAPSETPVPLEPSATPPPVLALSTVSATPALLPPTLAPTRTPSSPPTVPPLDDGSGRAIGGTGRDIFALTGLEEVDALPE